MILFSFCFPKQQMNWKNQEFYDANYEFIRWSFAWELEQVQEMQSAFLVCPELVICKVKGKMYIKFTLVYF